VSNIAREFLIPKRNRHSHAIGLPCPTFAISRYRSLTSRLGTEPVLPSRDREETVRGAEPLEGASIPCGAGWQPCRGLAKPACHCGCTAMWGRRFRLPLLFDYVMRTAPRAVLDKILRNLPQPKTPHSRTHTRYSRRNPQPGLNPEVWER